MGGRYVASTLAKTVKNWRESLSRAYVLICVIVLRADLVSVEANSVDSEQ